MTNPEEMAEIIVDDLNRTVGIVGKDTEINDAIAGILARRFPDVEEEDVRRAIRVANELLQERKSAAGIDLNIGLRPVKPISTTSLDIGLPENAVPVLELVDPATLWIDDSYQRNLSAGSLKKIARMIEQWDWNKYQPLTCVRVEINGRKILKVIDGQHRGISAASHPGIRELPVMVHTAPTIAAEAASFVGLNTSMMPVGPLQLHQSALIAGDADAITLQNVCERAGVRICRHPGDAREIGESTAVNCIASVINRRGARLTGDILSLLVRAEFSPIGANDIRASEFLQTSAEFRGKFKVADLVEAMKGNRVSLEKDARTFQATHGGVLFKCIARVWFAASRKRKTPAVKAVG